MDLVGSPVVKPLPIKSLNAYLSKVVMCTEASDLLKFRIHLSNQNYILSKAFKKVVTWDEGGSKMERKTGVIYG